MSKLQDAVAYLHEVDIESNKRRKISSISTLAIFLVTVMYVLVLVSFDKYNLEGIFSMILYLISISIVEDISLLGGLRKIKYIILLLLFLGVANPFFDRQSLWVINGISITGGMVSFITLFTKGVFSVMACYLMIVRIGMSGMALAMETLRIPKLIINVFLLIYRYIIVFIKEIDKMLQAYKLRSHNKKGIHISSWGSFAGLILLRSVDRANDVYNSMLLRGYDENKSIAFYDGIDNRNNKIFSITYVVIWITVFVLLRKIRLFSLVGEFID